MRRLGFTVIEEADFDIGNGYFMNDYVMEKKLYNRLLLIISPRDLTLQQVSWIQLFFIPEHPELQFGPGLCKYRSLSRRHLLPFLHQWLCYPIIPEI